MNSYRRLLIQKTCNISNRLKLNLMTMMSSELGGESWSWFDFCGFSRKPKFLFVFCRAHRNDLETLLPFLIIGYLYVLTKPNETAACYLFRIAGVSRLLHTVVYSIVVVPQPARAVTFWGTTGIMLYMAIVVMIKFYA